MIRGPILPRGEFSKGVHRLINRKQDVWPHKTKEYALGCDTRGKKQEQKVQHPIWKKNASTRHVPRGNTKQNDANDSLEALPSAIHLARTRNGKLSPRYTHGVAPQNIENPKTWRTAKVMTASPPLLFRWVRAATGVPGGARVKWPTNATTRAQTASQMAPVKRDYGGVRD